jgi:hypothetical protein
MNSCPFIVRCALAYGSVGSWQQPVRCAARGGPLEMEWERQLAAAEVEIEAAPTELVVAETSLSLALA